MLLYPIESYLTDDVAKGERVVERVRAEPGLRPREVRPSHGHRPGPLVRVFVAAVDITSLHRKPGRLESNRPSDSTHIYRRKEDARGVDPGRYLLY